jgi:Flp pilus assembly protein TadG
MYKRLLREEKGAVLPMVAIVLGLFLLAFTALVVDAGLLYLERRALVTAADAGALAGAKELSDNLSNTGPSEAIKDEAKKIAKETAVANGVASEDNVSVVIEKRNVQYKNNEGNLVFENRDIIEVKVYNTKQTIFARFMGDTEADVAATAVATWGYLKSISGGDILPIFSMNTLYTTSTIGAPIFLNGDKFLTQDSAIPGEGIVSGNWGLFDIKQSSIDPAGVTLRSALSGEASSKEMILKSTLESDTGQKIGQVDDVIQRMKNAVSNYPAPDKVKERQEYMRGLVPIIDYELFVKLNPIDKNNKLLNTLKLPIAYFAVFEIRDYLPKAEEGTEEALNTSSYMRSGVKKSYPGYAANTIVGVYTGGKVEVRAEIVSGDQILGAGEVKTLTWQKLIK